MSDADDVFGALGELQPRRRSDAPINRRSVRGAPQRAAVIAILEEEVMGRTEPVPWSPIKRRIDEEVGCHYKTTIDARRRLGCTLWPQRRGPPPSGGTWLYPPGVEVPPDPEYGGAVRYRYAQRRHSEGSARKYVGPRKLRKAAEQGIEALARVLDLPDLVERLRASMPPLPPEAEEGGEEGPPAAQPSPKKRKKKRKPSTSKPEAPPVEREEPELAEPSPAPPPTSTPEQVRLTADLSGYDPSRLTDLIGLVPGLRGSTKAELVGHRVRTVRDALAFGDWLDEVIAPDQAERIRRYAQCD